MKWILIVSGIILAILVSVVLIRGAEEKSDQELAIDALEDAIEERMGELERDERPAPTPKSLESQVRISDLECGYDEARGRITNNSNVTVEAFIDVQFLDSKGVVVDDSLGTIRGLRPGETGEWDAAYLGDGRYDSCRADISSVFNH